MAKYKSKIIGFILAFFTGPFSFLYLKKWKKTLAFSALMFIPKFNILVYSTILLLILFDVSRYNKRLKEYLRNGIIYCECGSYNKRGSRFCDHCGMPVTIPCKSCGTSRNDKYCYFCITGN
jgi:hypothetical protein